VTISGGDCHLYPRKIAIYTRARTFFVNSMGRDPLGGLVTLIILTLSPTGISRQRHSPGKTIFLSLPLDKSGQSFRKNSQK
jgi:hypothetical protein